jgi:hypothetical protein
LYLWGELVLLLGLRHRVNLGWSTYWQCWQALDQSRQRMEQQCVAELQQSHGSRCTGLTMRGKLGACISHNVGHA